VISIPKQKYPNLVVNISLSQMSWKVVSQLWTWSKISVLVCMFHVCLKLLTCLLVMLFRCTWLYRPRRHVCKQNYSIVYVPSHATWHRPDQHLLTQQYALLYYLLGQCFIASDHSFPRVKFLAKPQNLPISIIFYFFYRIFVEFGIHFKSMFAKLSEKTASLYSLTEYFDNKQNSTAT